MRRTLVAALLLGALFVTPARAHTEAERRKDLSRELAKHFDETWVTNIFNHQNLCAGRSVRQTVLSSWGQLKFAVMADVSLIRGEMFFRWHETVLRDAAARFGDPHNLLPYVTVAILRIESDLGENRAGTPVISVLFQEYATVVDGPTGDRQRKKILIEEILPFMRMAQENNWDVCGVLGTRAAAFGYPHFIPGSLRFATDGDCDGKTDLMWNEADAIASINNYLDKKGWKKDPRRAVHGYNLDWRYVDIVFSYARALKKRIE